MLKKMLLPLFAVVIAVASAFATPYLSQSAWYDSNGATAGGGVFDVITNPVGGTPVCSVSGSGLQCTIDGFDAYDTQANAEGHNSMGLLKRN